MNEVLAALQQAVVEAAERVGPAVVGIGRGWGRGSGVVVAPGQVLTVAHVLRGDEVAVTIGGEVVEGRVLGADPDLNVALLAVDTGDVEPVAWADEGVDAGAPVFALANPGGRGLRTTFGLVSATGRGFRGPRGRRVHRLDRAHRAAAARLLGRPAGRRRRQPARAQRGPPRRRLHPRAAGRRRAAPAGRRAGPRRGRRAAAARRRARSAAGGSPPAGGGRARPSATACSCARWSTAARPPRAGLERGDLLVRAGDRDLTTHGRSLRRARRGRRRRWRSSWSGGPRSASSRCRSVARKATSVREVLRYPGKSCRMPTVPSAVPPTSSAASGRCS